MNEFGRRALVDAAACQYSYGLCWYHGAWRASDINRGDSESCRTYDVTGMQRRQVSEEAILIRTRVNRL